MGRMNMTDIRQSESVLRAQGEDATTSTIDNASMTPFLRKITFFSSGGSFLDGYVLSLIGVALTQLTPQLGLASDQVSAIGAAALVGILLGSLGGGYLTDLIGRRAMFIIDVIAIALFSVLGMFAQESLQLIASRFFIGLFIGADYPIATSLIAEFTPQKHRALGMGIVSASWYLGATAASFVGWALFPFDDGWKWMLGSAVIPCVVLLIGRHDIPESPRWLMQKGRKDEARAVMDKVFGSDVALDSEAHAPHGFRLVFTKGYCGRTVFLCVMILCQVVPMYAIYTFGPDIMSAFGLNAGRDSILGESVVSLFFLIGTIPAMFWLNSVGRRRLLIVGLAFMLVGLLVLGIWPDAPILVIMAAFAVYAFFSGGPGILQWLYPNELFPTEARATAVGVAIAASRIGVIISTYGLPLFMQTYGVGVTMLVAAGLVLIGLVWSVISAPETAGKSLQETSTLHTK